MSVLIVEDNPERIRLFRQGFIGVSTTVITDAPMAIGWLKDHTPNLILLDFDLHEHGASRFVAGCGLDVARFLARWAARFRKTLILIHSLNRTGAEKMLKVLKNKELMASLHPFLWDEQKTMERLTREARDMEK